MKERRWEGDVKKVDANQNFWERGGHVALLWTPPFVLEASSVAACLGSTCSISVCVRLDDLSLPHFRN